MTAWGAIRRLLFNNVVYQQTLNHAKILSCRDRQQHDSSKSQIKARRLVAVGRGLRKLHRDRGDDNAVCDDKTTSDEDAKHVKKLVNDIHCFVPRGAADEIFSLSLLFL